MDELLNYLDSLGKIKTFPSKKKNNIRHMIYKYIISKFDNSLVYSEFEVNKILKEWCLFEDYVLVRREMFDNFYFDRSLGGMKYQVGKKVFLMSLPKDISDIVFDLEYEIDNIGRSNDKTIIFENKYVLKISESINELQKEKSIIDWLDGKLITNKSILFVIEENKAYYLKTYLKGTPLIDKDILNNPSLLIDHLVDAFNLIGDIKDCPYKSATSGNDFIHGDLCLPNIYLTENGIGFIDLLTAGIGDRWRDIAWMIWSLEYNLGNKEYTNVLLDRLGVEFDQSKFDFYTKEND